MNLDKLWSLVPAEKREEYLTKKSDKAPVLDLLSLGYSKVLGKGRLPNVPIVVRARYVSKEAEKKSTTAPLPPHPQQTFALTIMQSSRPVVSSSSSHKRYPRGKRSLGFLGKSDISQRLGLWA